MGYSTCPIKSRPLLSLSLSVFSWLTQLWEHHVAPRIEETLLHSRRLEGQHHQQTAHLLLRAVVDRTFRPTCPLGIGGVFRFLFNTENIYIHPEQWVHVKIVLFSSKQNFGLIVFSLAHIHQHTQCKKFSCGQNRGTKGKFFCPNIA